MPASTSEPVIVGKIVAPYGVKGWVKIHSYTEPDTNILDYRPLSIQRGENWEPVEIDAGRRHGKGIVAHVVGCDDRNQAGLIAQCALAVSADQLPDLVDDDYYWRQLEGFEVYARTDKGPVMLGRIAWLFATGANDVMVVEGTTDSIDQRQRLIPWVPGQHVLEVDVEAGQVTVDWDPDF